MAWLRGRALRWVLGVSAFWLLIGGAIVQPVLPPEQAAEASAFASPIGRSAYISVPSRVAWTIPIDRGTFDAYYWAVWVDDGDAINAALARPGWIAVADRQAVRIVAVDRDAVQVELLDGQDAGRQAWLKAHHLSP